MTKEKVMYFLSLCAQKLSTHNVDRHVETLSTEYPELCTGVSVFGFRTTYYSTRLCEAVAVWFSTGFPHSSHIQNVFDLCKKGDSQEKCV